MTENDPTAHENRGSQPGEAAAEQAGWIAGPTEQHEQVGQPAYGEQSTTPHGPFGAEQPYTAPNAAPNPWSAQAQGHPYGPMSQPNPLGQPVQPGVHGAQYGTAVYPDLTQQGHQPQQAVATKERSAPAGSGKLIAGVAALALLIGGGAGAAGGYLAGGGGGTTAINALNAPVPAQQTANAPAGSIEAVAQKLTPSVVELQVSGGSGSGEGSGFVLSTDGYILTNNHVVEVAANGGQIQALFQDGRKATATIVGRDPTTDIAVVKVNGVSGLTPVELGRSDNLQVGQGVVAIGSPFQLPGTVTSGIVSSLHRPVRAGGSTGTQATVMDAVQTDAAINPGNSGGPLANMAGQVIGINSAIYSPQSASGGLGAPQSQGGNVGIGFAIPIDQARRTADDIIKTGHAVQTFIGAQVQDATQGGAQIGAITPGSPAEKSGLKAGDVVTKIDSRLIPNADALVAAIRTQAPGVQVKLTLADSRVLNVTLGGQPVPAN
jgi:putative serine protease PepD